MVKVTDDTKDLDRFVAFLAFAAFGAFLVWAWARASGKAEQVVAHPIRVSAEAIRRVWDRADEITREAAESAGKEGAT